MKELIRNYCETLENVNSGLLFGVGLSNDKDSLADMVSGDNDNEQYLLLAYAAISQAKAYLKLIN